MDATIEASQSGGLATKPSPPPKPSLAPKPFSLQKNSTIRSFKAPKTVSKTAPTPKSETSQTKKFETKISPTTTVTTPAEKLPQPISSPETALKTDPTPNSEATQTKKSETKSPRTTAVTIPTEELTQLISSSETALKTAPTAEPKTSQTKTKSSPTTTITTPAEKLPQPISSPETVLKTAPTPNPEVTQTKKSETKSSPSTTITTPAEKLSQPISSSETAPKTLNSETNRIEQSETENPSAVTIPAKNLPQPTSASAPKPQSASVLPKSQPEASKTSETLQQIENSLGAETAALDPATETAPTKGEPKSEPAQEDIIQINHKPPTIAVASSEQKDGEEKQSDAPVSVSQNIEEPNSNGFSTNDSFYQRGSVRKRLPKALTSKFESGGIPLPRQSFRAIPKPITKDESNKPESSDAQHVHTTPEPPVKECDTDAGDFTGGNSIKKRISLLFDSVSKPEVTTKREEAEIANGIGGVKEQIKNWASETGPEDQKVEKSPQAADGVCSKALKTETPGVEVPAAEETPPQPVDSRSTVSSPTGSEIEPPKEEPFKDKPLENATETPAETDKAKEDDVQVQSSQLAAAAEKQLAELKRKKKKNRRSVRFGTVVADDGTPPVVLGPEPESSEDEKQEDNAEVESKKKGEDSASMRFGTLQRKSDETQSQETLKHQQKEEESGHPRSMMEEELKQMKDEDAREKEKAREDELERKRLEEERRETKMELLRQKQVEEERERERARLEEKQRKKARMREERERQWQKDEEERLKLEEDQRQKEEEERKRRELEGQRQKELKDEEERLKLEEDQRQKEEEERRKYEQRRMELERMRREEEERLRQEELEKEKLRQELEREQVRREEEKERMRQEDQERNRRELERKMQQEKEEEEERRKYEQRRMELERMRKEEEERLRQEELEKEKLRQELERKMQQEKEEEERKRKEEIKLQMEKKMEESQPRTAEENNKREEKLIDFDAEEPPAFPSSHVSKNTESLVNVVYDDFSIQKPVLDVAFDDFSVKPRRRTFQPRRETAPISSDWRVEPLRKDDLLLSFDSKPLETQQEHEPKQPEAMLVPTQVPETPEEEKVKTLLAEFGVKEEGDDEAENPVADQPVEMKEEEKMENVAEMKDEGEEKDNTEPQVNSHITNDEDKLIQTLLRNEQDGISEQTSGPDSPTHVPDPVPDASEDLDNTDSQREMDLDAVCENSAPLLDNSSQKSKAVLGRRLTRTRPSRSLRLESAEAARIQLSVYNDEKDNQSDSEEEPPKSKPVYSSPSSTQRVAMFPGLSPADLLSGLKRKTGGVAAKAEEGSAEDRGEQETESQSKKVAPSQVSGSPRLAAHLAGAKRVLPPAVGKDGGLWPKKRTTQQNGET